MDFFDGVGKKFNEVADKVLSKTKEITDSTISQTKSMSDVSKLKYQQKTIEKNLNSYYYQLGKAYYENSGDNCEYIYSEIVSVIDEENKKLDDITKKIDSINGVRRCQECNSKVPADSKFCNICGAKLEIIEPEDTNILDSDNQDIEEDNKEPIDNEEASEELVEIEKKICLGCGGELPDDASYCTNCGTKYEG